MLDPSMSHRQAKGRDSYLKFQRRHYSYSEIKSYKHATEYKWTADELITTLKLIKSNKFKVEDDFNIALHNCVAQWQLRLQSGVSRVTT